MLMKNKYFFLHGGSDVEISSWVFTSGGGLLKHRDPDWYN